MQAWIGHLAVALALAGMLPGAVLAATATPTASASAAGVSELLGVWQTEDNSRVTISVCPEGFCGVLTYVSTAPAAYAKLSPAEKKAADAQDPAHFPDTKNKDASLRTRSLVGLKMFVVKASDKPAIFNGTLYNPQDGGTYDGNIRIESPTQMLLSGCLFKVLCRSQEWSRVTVAK